MLEFLIGAIANLFTRFLPFIFFKKHANKFLFLKEDFPVVLITILTLYILFPDRLNTILLKFQLLGILITITIHLIARNALLSIFLGSLCYIYLIN
ncbi:hypothetical protein JCM13304A_24710 [Desulfothermus okinawensis JCM 13304]